MITPDEKALLVEAREIDAKGRCCGRKPIPYKRPDRLFCPRCEAQYDTFGKQEANWAWRACGDAFIATYPNQNVYVAHLRRGLELAERANMAAFSASDAACYLYPGENEGNLRQAFVAGAEHIAGGA